jgi:CheY-like chemotaxis protein
VDVPIGAIPEMSDEEKSGKKRQEILRSQDSRGLASRFMQQVTNIRAQSDEGDKPAPMGSRETLRQEAEASAHILRRLLPKLDMADEGDTSGEGLSKAEAGKRILLADDDPMMRNSLRMAFEQAGYYVVSTATGEEAWNVFSKNPSAIDVLVSDISMPAMDGASLAHRARLLRPHLRIILMSGYFDEKAAGDLIKDARVAFLAKPFSLDRMLEEIRRNVKAV